ncbi:ATP-grasp domain-containing protein [Azoarcus sp. L1K30]|uniref:arsenate reductase/protein-tyrosine-phosphatase family protein n=1 Tax=Azoarcus sp. L1K30 TaxID=2820277 RepID=UPI001B837247|nr:ATP-grasp domain-containing protein [Azoarcus sp. L1K30]MBR0568582.1 ATP-grasp domain-containing protein [Azoarcus sp. L1K30]
MTAAHATRRVLVLDGDLPPALTIARSLRRMGVTVDIASHETKPIAGYSRAVDEKYRYPSPLENEEEFINWVGARLTDARFDLIIPVTERTVTPLLKHRQRIRDERLAMAGSDALAVVLDKARTGELAAQLNIPLPASRLVTSIDEATAAGEELGYPVVIKPVSSVAGRGAGNVQLSVSYALNARELESRVRDALRYGDALLQERFEGDGVGIELIADHGRIVYAFQHLRLHEVPLTGGGSSLRASVAVEPALLDAASRLMTALDWHGVAMVEFKRNAATGEFRLMEINGRFWGSLPLAVHAGADFPAMLYELMVEGRVAPRPAYRNGIKVRNLSRDVFWHELVLRKDAPAGLVAIPSGRQVVSDLALVFRPEHRFDVQSWRDPLPGLIDMGRIAASYYHRLAGIFKERRERAKAHAQWQGGAVAKALADANNILFLCYGNINRSAVAERYASTVLKNGPHVTSAGFHHESGRPADPIMTEVAAARGVDMLYWSSRSLDADMVAHADAIFVMELQHRDRVLDAFPEARNKVFLLGMGRDASEIADPYGLPRADYERSLNQVLRGVDEVAAMIGSRH